MKSHSGTEIVRNWPRGHSHYILEKNLVAFSPFPENLNEIELKNKRLIYLVEGSRWNSIQVVLQIKQ